MSSASARHNLARRARARAFVDAIKRFCGPCRDCGAKHHLTFDHVRGTKVAEISRMVSRGASLHVIVTEIEKCELVCIWCHDRREVERGRKGMTFQVRE